MQQLKNIDTAFKHIRLFTAVMVIACASICCFAIFFSHQQVSQAHQRVYLISGGQALEAFASSRKDNIPAEARSHVRNFHAYFFNLSPDEKAIETTITRALYLADISAKQQYDALKEKGYFSALISGNVSQQVECDSVYLNTGTFPYHFRYYGRQQIIRTSAIITRSLVTEGYLRSIDRSDHNSHGFLIERWRTLENKDISTTKR